jgi:hypothetical protein
MSNVQLTEGPENGKEVITKELLNERYFKLKKPTENSGQ